nr:ribonuclease H-like domain-containing protein [Tanacetum cinerariifolium]
MSDHEDETITAENVPPKTIPQITTVTNISTKFPYLKKGEYDIWAMKMQNLISSSDLLCWHIVLKGNSAKSMTTDNDGNLKIRPLITAEEHQQVQREEKARTILLPTLPDEHMGDFYHMIDTKGIWNAIKARVASDTDSQGAVVSADSVIFADGSIPAGTIVAAAVSPSFEIEFALMGLSTEAKWNNSGQNLYKLINSSMSVRTKRGLGLDKYIGEGEMGIDDSVFSIFHTTSDDLEGQPIYNRFASVDHMRKVPPPLIKNYMPPSNIPNIDESHIVYGKKATDSSEIKPNDDSISPSHNYVLFDFSDSYLHLIKDCDLHEQRLVKRHAKGKGIWGRRPKPKPVSTGQPKPVFAGKTKPVSTGKPKPVSAGQPKPVSTRKPKPVYTSKLKPVFTGQPNLVSAGDGLLGP